MIKLGALQAAWQRRAARERLLLLAVAVGVLAVAVDSLWTAPLEKRVKRARQEVQSLNERAQQQRAARAGQAVQAAQLQAQESSLRERLQAAQAASMRLRQRVADASRLPGTLRTLTASVGSVRLLELELVGDAGAAAPAAPSPVAAAASGASAASVAPTAPRRLYRLPVVLKVSGSYDELQQLLTQLEQEAQALHWNSLVLEGSQWPAIQLTLRAHVLSLDPRWGAP